MAHYVAGSGGFGAGECRHHGGPFPDRAARAGGAGGRRRAELGGPDLGADGGGLGGPGRGVAAAGGRTGGVVTWIAFDPSGHPAPGPGGPAGRTQQTTSPLASEPSVAQPAAGGTRPSTLASRKPSTPSRAPAGPSASSRDAPARAAESAAVCAEVRAAQFSPTSTTSAANPSSTVMESTTVMATLPRSSAPRARNIVGDRPRSPPGQPVRDESPGTRGTASSPGAGPGRALTATGRGR